MTKQSPPQRSDDDQLQRYLAGGSSLSHAYRSEADEVTPPELDRAVLEMAHAAVPPRGRRVSRWQLPLALAATLLIGVPLAWNVTRQAPRMEPASGISTPVAEAPVPEVSAAPAATAQRSREALAAVPSVGPVSGIEAASERRQDASRQKVDPPARKAGEGLAGLNDVDGIGPANEVSTEAEAPQVAGETAEERSVAEMDVAAGAPAPVVTMQSLMAPPPATMAPASKRSAESVGGSTPSRSWGVPTGWNLAQTTDGRYQVGVDLQAPHDGAASAVLQGQTGRGWVELSQRLSAVQYRGLRLRLRGFLRTDLRGGQVQLWLHAGAADAVRAQGRIDAAGTVLSGAHGWQRVDVVIDVPADAETISLGVLLFAGDGEAHVDQLSLVAVPPGLAADDAIRDGPPPLPQPINPGFEEFVRASR